jgi:hypothetical protein
MTYKQIRNKPHWPTWQHVAFVTLWEGVLLAHDIEPANYPYDERDLEYAARTVSPDMMKWENVQRRLLVATRAVSPSGQLENTPYYADEDTRVPLGNFARWAKNVVNWADMPAELAKLAEPKQQPVPVGRWPWGDYETKLLRVMDAVARKWWINYDPKDPTTAKTKDVIVSAIMADHG